MDTTFNQRCKAKLNELTQQEAICNHSVKELTTLRDEIDNFLSSALHKLELLKLSSIFVQSLVDQVSKKNIERINSLVNTALGQIFYDMDVKFQLDQDIKRNINTYSLSILFDGNPGDEESCGGGIMAIIAFVLKTILLLFSKTYPFLGLDESLTFISLQYIPNTSKFIKEMSKEFSLPIMLVTHQPAFAEYANINYDVIRKSEGKKQYSVINRL